MKFKAAKEQVKNRGSAPDTFLEWLVAWGNVAPDEIFEANKRYDIYSSVMPELGPYKSLKHRKAVMLEVLRVLAGFESSWRWNTGKDKSNAKEDTQAEYSAGPWQVSADSRRFGTDLRRLGPSNPVKFQQAMKENPMLATEYVARLLRYTTKHHGPVRDRLIHSWLSRAAVAEFEKNLD